MTNNALEAIASSSGKTVVQFKTRPPFVCSAISFDGIAYEFTHQYNIGITVLNLIYIVDVEIMWIVLMLFYSSIFLLLMNNSIIYSAMLTQFCFTWSISRLFTTVIRNNMTSVLY